MFWHLFGYIAYQLLCIACNDIVLL